MSKGKRARFSLRAHENILKKGMMDFCMTGQYRYFAAGDAVLTDQRLYFGAELSTGEYVTFDLPLVHIFAVEKIGVPFFTRSMLVTTDERQYRLNAFFVGRWVRPLRRAVEAAKEKAARES